MDGFERASPRAVAASAEVTAGLVLHPLRQEGGTARRLRRTRPDGPAPLVPRGCKSRRNGGVLSEFLANPDEYRLHMGSSERRGHTAANGVVKTMVDESEAIFPTGVAGGTMDPRATRGAGRLHGAEQSRHADRCCAAGRSLGSDSSGPEVLRRMS